MWSFHLSTLSASLILVSATVIIATSGSPRTIDNNPKIGSISTITTLTSDDNVAKRPGIHINSQHQFHPHVTTPQFTILAFAGPVKRYTTKYVSASGYPPAMQARSKVLVTASRSEGHYKADNNEKFYDDGSYKPEYTEKLYDDGTYKGENIYWYKGKRIYW